MTDGDSQQAPIDTHATRASDEAGSELVRLLAAASSVQCRAAAIQTAGAVVEWSGVTDPRATAGLEELRRGRYGDTAVRRAVAGLVHEFDTRAWDIQDRIDDGEDLQVDHLAAFKLARAIAALASAGETDPRAAATDAIYEALHAVDDRSLVMTVAVAALQ